MTPSKQLPVLFVFSSQFDSPFLKPIPCLKSFKKNNNKLFVRITAIDRDIIPAFS